MTIMQFLNFWIFCLWDIFIMLLYLFWIRQILNFIIFYSRTHWSILFFILRHLIISYKRWGIFIIKWLIFTYIIIFIVNLLIFYILIYFVTIKFIRNIIIFLIISFRLILFNILIYIFIIFTNYTRRFMF